MLRATRRLLRPGGRTAFTTIHLADGLDGRRRRRALAAGPVVVSTGGREYPELLSAAGFVRVEQVDVTSSYQTVQRTWLRHALALADELDPSELPNRFKERIDEQLAARAALEHGLLRRSLFVAHRAGLAAPPSANAQARRRR